MSKTFRIVFAGGGSGGHVYPLVAIAEAVQKIWTGVDAPLFLYYMGPRDDYAAMIEEHGLELRPIVTGKLRRYFSIQNIIDIPKFFIGLMQAFWKLYWIMPDVIFSKGGSGALPVVVAGWWYRIPVVIHESDSVPGSGNLHSARFAKKVCVSFPDAADYFDPKKVVVTGTPIRAELLEGQIETAAAKDSLGFSSSHPLIVVIGGSQGAQTINLFIVENLKAIMGITQVLHQTGTANFAEMERLSQAALMNATYENRYLAQGYFDDQTMKLALSAADIVVSRSGSSIFEIAAFKKPMILIPYPADASNGHQSANAHAFERVGAAVVIEEPNLFPGIFMSELKRILGDAGIRDAMGAAAGTMVAENSAELIAREVLKAGK